MEEEIKKIAKCCQEGNHFLLISHIDPDGDAIGSLLALGRALKLAGKRVYMVSPDQVPIIYRFLPGWEEVVHSPEELPELYFDFDYVITLDVADRSRLGKWEWVVKHDAKVINIDHHVTNTKFGQINWIRQAGATGQLVFMLLRQLNWEIDQCIALALYTAIVTDTGSFCYASTDSTTHQIAAELLAVGINPTYVTELVFESKPVAAIKLLGLALQSLEIHFAGKVATLTITQKDLTSANATDDDISGIVNYARGIAGVELGILFFEKEARLTKISFRSGLGIDVRKIAGQFAGGGHPQAAGCQIAASLLEAQKLVLQAVSQLLTGKEGINERHPKYPQTTGNDIS
ncbi:MAG: DHH family phosphoesterase [bacterium]